MQLISFQKLVSFLLGFAVSFSVTNAVGADASKQTRASIKSLNAAAFSAYENNNLPAAYRYYLKAADLGEPSAMYNLAVMRINNEVKRPNLAQAHKILKRSAELGFAPAQFMLATVLESTSPTLNNTAAGKQKGIEQALIWYEKAAIQGHPDASLAVGTAYFLGRGTTLDYVKALRWYTQAADFGDVAAQYLVASMHESATGTPKNLETALMWYIAAARQGDIAAREKSKYLNEIISKEKQS